MPPAYVKANLSKTDAADAEANCRAVMRPPMRFFAGRSAEKQAVLMFSRPVCHNRPAVVPLKSAFLDLCRAKPLIYWWALRDSNPEPAD